MGGILLCAPGLLCCVLIRRVGRRTSLVCWMVSPFFCHHLDNRRKPMLNPRHLQGMLPSGEMVMWQPHCAVPVPF